MNLNSTIRYRFGPLRTQWLWPFICIDIWVIQNHYLDPEKGGHTKYITGTASYFRRKFDERAVKIGDMRGREDEFDLNTQGFQFYESPTIGGDFRDVDKVKAEVYPETEELLKKVYVCHSMLLEATSY